MNVLNNCLVWKSVMFLPSRSGTRRHLSSLCCHKAEVVHLLVPSWDVKRGQKILASSLQKAQLDGQQLFCLAGARGGRCRIGTWCMVSWKCVPKWLIEVNAWTLGTAVPLNVVWSNPCAEWVSPVVQTSCSGLQRVSHPLRIYRSLGIQDWYLSSASTERGAL